MSEREHDDNCIILESRKTKVEKKADFFKKIDTVIAPDFCCIVNTLEFSLAGNTLLTFVSSSRF